MQAEIHTIYRHREGRNKLSAPPWALRPRRKRSGVHSKVAARTPSLSTASLESVQAICQLANAVFHLLNSSSPPHHVRVVGAEFQLAVQIASCFDCTMLPQYVVLLRTDRGFRTESEFLAHDSRSEARTHSFCHPCCARDRARETADARPLSCTGAAPRHRRHASAPVRPPSGQRRIRS